MSINSKSMYVVLAFGFSRAVLFLSPLLIANLVSVSLYGQLEAGLAAGAIVCVAALLGMPALLPLAKIQKRKGVSAGVAWCFALVVSILGVSASILLLFFELFGLAFVIAVATSLSVQAMLSSNSKSDGAVAKGLLYDASLMTCLVGGIAIAGFFGPLHDLGVGTLGVIASVAAGLLILKAVKSGFYYFDKPALKSTLIVGMSVMLTNVSSVILMSSGRLGAFALLGSEQAGRYAAIYRVSILPVALYQLASNLIFRNLYSGSNDDFDKRTSSLLLLVLSVCIFLDALSLQLGALFGPAFNVALEFNGAAFSVMIYQVVLWCAVSQFEILISRLELNKRWLLRAICLAAFFACVVVIVALEVDTLFKFALLHLALVVGYVLTQLIVVSSKGFDYWRSCGVVLAAMLCLTLSLFS